MAILSIQSEFAEAIFSGKKTFELRKTALGSNVTYVVLYERERAALTGGFAVGGIVKDKVRNLWSKIGEKATSRDRFFEYFRDYKRGIAIEIRRAERFDTPISVEELRSIDPSFSIPSSFNFLYVSAPIVERINRESRVLAEVLRASKPRPLESWDAISFRRLEDDEVMEFEQLAVENIRQWYDEIDASFARNIVESDRLGFDPKGYFTKCKCIYVILERGTKVGYTVVTEKRGGSVKFGPTIILESHQGKGIAPRMRRLLEDHYQSRGYRKSYSTIPDCHLQAFSYLVKSGSVVEAHLRFQYSNDHHELVMGRLLQTTTPRAVSAVVPEEPTRDSEIVDRIPDERTFRHFIIDTMEPNYDEIDEVFVKNIVDAQDRFNKSTPGEKGKKIFSLTDGETIYGSAICSIKRGRSVKIAPFLLRASVQDGCRMLEEIEDFLESLGEFRKFYSLVPLNDRSCMQVFLKSGYHPEGLLREPYKSGIDAVFLGRMVTIGREIVQ